jgi:pyruvate dehydrogenase complex dehydrogenase (E1) component
VIATLYALCEEGDVKAETVERAIKELGVDPAKLFPASV